MSYSSNGASPYETLPGLSNHPPASNLADHALARHLGTLPHPPQPDQQQVYAAQSSTAAPNDEAHRANAHAHSPLPGLVDSFAQPRLSPQSSNSVPQPAIESTTKPSIPEDVTQHLSLSYPVMTGAQATAFEQSEDADMSEELEEGELSDSDFEPDPLPEHLQTNHVADTYQSDEPTSIVTPQSQLGLNLDQFTREIHHKPAMPAGQVDRVSEAYLLEQRQAAKMFIKFSGLTYQQLAGEGFNQAMLQSLFQELGIFMQPETQPQPVAANVIGTTQSQNGSAGQQSAQLPKPANREEYLARLKALQKKPSSVAPQGDSALSHTITTAKTLTPAQENGSAATAKQAINIGARDSAIAAYAIRVTGTTSEKKAANIFSKANRSKIRKVERQGNDLDFYFDSAEDVRTTLEQLPFHYKQAGKGKLHAHQLPQPNTSHNDLPSKPSTVIDPTPVQTVAKNVSSTANEEDAAVRLRKEKLARLREEALKSAKAAQAKKELAAARAGAWLDNFSTEPIVGSSSSTPVQTPANLKRPAASDLANPNPGPFAKRPFGQPRYEDEQDDCIIEASDDEVNSDSGKALAQAKPHAAGLVTPMPATEGLEAHELKIQEMRRKIKELEQRNKAKANSSNSTPARDVHTPITPARSAAIPVPLLAQSPLTVRAETPVPAGVSPAEWKKQRRDQIQSTLPAYNAKVASTANKLAILKKQMMELEESMQQEENERQRLLQELEDLGMDTGTMPDMPIEELKATRDELNAQLETQTTDEQEAASIPLLDDERLVVESELEQKKTTTSDTQSQVTGAPPNGSALPPISSAEVYPATDNETADAMDISEADSDSGEDYEPSGAPQITSVDDTEVVQSIDKNAAIYEPPEPLPAPSNLQQDGSSDYQLELDQSRNWTNASRDEPALLPTALEESGRNATIDHQFPEVVNLESDGDSIYGDAADDDQPDDAGTTKASTTNDFVLSSTDDEGNAKVQGAKESLETGESSQGTSDSASETGSTSSADVSMDQSESEDDYEPPEVSVQPEQLVPLGRELPRESSSESASSSSEAYQRVLDACDEDDMDNEDEPYAPPDAGLIVPSAWTTAGVVPDNAVSQAAADNLSLTVEKQPLREDSASGNLDVGTIAHAITCANEGQESLRKVAETYRPYESPLKMFKAYRQHPDFQKEIPGGFSSLTFSNSIDSNTPLCPFESAGGVCNDTKCNAQHFRSMSLSAEDMLNEIAALDPAYSEEEAAEFSKGLSTLRADFVKEGQRDYADMASHITAYRRRFLGDASRVLNL